MQLLPKSVKSVLFIVIQLASIIVIFISGTVLQYKIIYYCLIILCLIPGVWGMYTMKFRFNVAPDLIYGSKFVTTGPYKYIRHPMYTSVLGITLIIVVFSFSYFLLMMWLILLVDLIMKLSYEENILLKEFSGYSGYKSKTKRLIPFVY